MRNAFAGSNNDLDFLLPPSVLAGSVKGVVDIRTALGVASDQDLGQNGYGW